jgi:hypothetical protein
MTTATLVTHNPKFNAQLVTLSQLGNLPMPQAMGPRHRPVAHFHLVEAVLEAAERFDLVVTRQQFALSESTHAIFGVLDFTSQHSDRSTSLGFRNSTDQTLAMGAVAGSHVFVCDTWSHKNTTGVRLQSLVYAGFEKFVIQAKNFDRSVERLQASTITDGEAKAKMWDVFAGGVLPARLVDDADRNYFRPDAEWTDCAPRSLWGVHNALTRAIRALSPTRQIEASTDIGRIFGIGAE